MLARSTKMYLLFLSTLLLALLCSLIPSLIFAEPIGSLKSLKNYKIIPVNEAPISDVDNIKKSTTNNKTDNNTGNITRSQFTTAVVNREPTDNVIMLTSNSSKIYYFTELSNFKGHNVTHRWQYQGKLMAEINFDVKSDRWRVFSSKTIRPDWTGEWSVDLVDENGTSLQTSKLKIVATTYQD